MKRNDIRVVRTHSQLFDGLMRLLITKTFDEITVSEICEASGVHRATFYNHFNDKYEFLNSCFQNKLEAITFDRLEKGSTPEIIRRNILHFVECLLMFVDENRVLFTATCGNNYSFTFNSSFAAAINKYCYEKLNSVLTAPSHRIMLTSEFYSGAIVGVIKWYIFSANKDLLKDTMEFIEHRVDELCSFYEKYLFETD